MAFRAKKITATGIYCTVINKQRLVVGANIIRPPACRWPHQRDVGSNDWHGGGLVDVV